MKKLILILVLAVLVLGCTKKEQPVEPGTGIEPSETEQIPPQEAGGNVFHKDFQLIMPQGWKEVEIPPATFIYLPEGSDYTDPNTENINIIITNLQEDYKLDLNEITQQGIEESKKLLPDLTLTEGPVKAVLGPMEGLMTKFEVTIAGEKMEYTQIVAEKFNSLYAATHSCPAGKCSYDNEFDAMLESLEPVDSRKR